jgi:hypothetical protein
MNVYVCSDVFISFCGGESDGALLLVGPDEYRQQSLFST